MKISKSMAKNLAKSMAKAKSILDLNHVLGQREMIPACSNFGHLKKLGPLINVFTGIPIPPSENEILMPCRGRLIHSPAARGYKIEFRKWALCNLGRLRAMKPHLQKPPYKLDILLGFPRERIFWKIKGTPRKIDGPNFLKLLIDCFSEVLEVDDSIFFSNLVIKYAVDDSHEVGAAIRILPTDYFSSGMLEDFLAEGGIHG